MFSCNMLALIHNLMSVTQFEASTISLFKCDAPVEGDYDTLSQISRDLPKGDGILNQVTDLLGPFFPEAFSISAMII